MWTQQETYEHPLVQFGYRRLPHRLWRFSPRLFVLVSRLCDVWFVVSGRLDLHRAYEHGKLDGALGEYRRIILNGGDLVPHLTALRGAKGALWEMWPTVRRDEFENDPDVKAINAVLARYEIRS